MQHFPLWRLYSLSELTLEQLSGAYGGKIEIKAKFDAGTLMSGPQGSNKQEKGSNFKLCCEIRDNKNRRTDHFNQLTEGDGSRFTPTTHTCAHTHHRTKALCLSPTSFVCSPPQQLSKIIPLLALI
ncbi:hypothetical protein CEXT_137231 [Caerostris extrusa]|uniref:Uncharacterized protein n=1 Tax=Caerostris extrusa TaxID=172846 RepID=A0AAV4Y912_CAEEX|nr:hypothetical protein CEXT_137231 [Caerostris extrusa]